MRLRQLLGLALAVILATGAADAKPLTVGFYLPWDKASQASLVAHAASLDVLAPMSGALVSAEGALRWQEDPARVSALARRKARQKIFPVISNAHDNVWDTAAADGVLLDAAAGEAFIAALVNQAKAQGYGGYILDFETLSPQAAPAYAPLLARLRTALQPLGRELWVTALLSTDATTFHQLASASDAVVLMAYDQCWATGTPGPIAGQDWLENNLDAKFSVGQADPAHVIVALGASGYDWPAGQPAVVVSTPEALRIAKAADQAPIRGAPDANPHFSYAGPDGVNHAVWYLDAATFQAQRAAVQSRHARGAAIWRLGLEDPMIWAKNSPHPSVSPAPAMPRQACLALPPRP
jgi:spore germination protein YaaH